MRILVVEDEPHLADAIRRHLKENNYSVDLAADGEEALAFTSGTNYDAIVLDLMLPVLDGATVLRRLRSQGDTTPVLVLTARDGLSDKVKTLDTGADDYLTKPFAFDELLARLRAILRREQVQPRQVKLRSADLELDTVTRRVQRGGVEITLTNKEYALLEYLLRNRGHVLTRAQISEHVWDYDFSGLSNIVDVYIRYLRRKIDDDFEPKLIETIRGAGYRLRAVDS